MARSIRKADLELLHAREDALAQRQVFIDELDDGLEARLAKLDAMGSEVARMMRRGRWIRKLALALNQARTQKPKADHFTVDKLKKLGAPKTPRAVKKVVRENRLALLRACRKVALDMGLPRWDRAPFYEASKVWL